MVFVAIDGQKLPFRANLRISHIQFIRDGVKRTETAKVEKPDKRPGIRIVRRLAPDIGTGQRRGNDGSRELAGFCPPDRPMDTRH